MLIRKTNNTIPDEVLDFQSILALKLKNRLIRKEPLTICDEVLDRSGALLGEIRNAQKKTCTLYLIFQKI